MPLNKDTLGMELYGIRQMFSNKTLEELIDEYGDLEEARKQACIKEAEVFINHLKANATLTIPGTGMVAGSVAVTGTSITGKLT